MAEAELYTAATPYLSVVDCPAAIAFYEAAFGAVRTGPTLTTPDGTIVHTELRIGAARVMLSEAGEHGRAPTQLGGTTARMSLDATDADRAFAQAVAAGAEIVIPLADQFYGHRSGRVRDPFGHEWIIGQPLERLSEGEMQARLDAMMSGDA